VKIDDEMLVRSLAALADDIADDAEAERRATVFKGVLARLHADPEEAARIDAIAAEIEDRHDLTVEPLHGLRRVLDEPAWLAGASGVVIDEVRPEAETDSLPRLPGSSSHQENGPARGAGQSSSQQNRRSFLCLLLRWLRSGRQGVGRARTRRRRVIAVIGAFAVGLAFVQDLTPAPPGGSVLKAMPGGAFRETTPGGAQVTTKLDEGTITVTELAEAPASALATTRPLGRPIHVEAADASLAEPATIAFPVPELPAGLDPAKDVAIATRSAATGYSWELVGGVYDPVTRTVSVETTHFSDWMAVVTSPARLASEAVGFVSDLLKTAKPDSTCQDRRLELDVVILDVVAVSADPDLNACMFETAAHKVLLEIGNPHGFPLILELPGQVDVDSADSTPDTAWTAAVEALRDSPTLAPNSKRTFTVDRSWFNENPADQNRALTVTASVDVPTFIYDMTEFVASLVLGIHLDKLGDRTRSTDPDRQHQLIDCVYSASTRLTTTGALTSGFFLDGVYKIVKDCYGPEVDASAAASAQKLGVVVDKGAARFLFRSVDLLFRANEFRRTFDEFYSTVNIPAAEDSYHPTVTPADKAKSAPPEPERRCVRPDDWWNVPGWIGYSICHLQPTTSAAPDPSPATPQP
jgi:hypothetical protein